MAPSWITVVKRQFRYRGEYVCPFCLTATYDWETFVKYHLRHAGEFPAKKKTIYWQSSLEDGACHGEESDTQACHSEESNTPVEFNDFDW